MDLSIVQTPTFNAVMAIVAVLSFLFAIYSHRKGISKQKLSYYVFGRSIITRKRLGGFDREVITVGGNEAEELYFVSILIYNSGNMAIEPNDLADDGICIEYKDSDEGDSAILGQKIVETDNPSGKFKIYEDQDRKRLSIAFKFIPPKSGFMVEILSDRKHSDFYVNAATKNFGRIRRSLPYNNISGTLLILSPILVFLLMFPVSDKMSSFVANIIGAERYELFPSMISMFAYIVLVFTLAYVIYIIVSKFSRILFGPSIARFYQQMLVS